MVALAMAVSMMGTLNGTILSGGRLAYAPAREGYFLRAFAQVHPRFHTPTVALAAQCVLAAALLEGARTAREGAAGHLLFYAVAFGLAAGAAALSYRFFERPMLRLKDRYFASTSAKPMRTCTGEIFKKPNTPSARVRR